MRLRDLFISKAGAVVLAAGLTLGGSVLAQDGGVPETTITTQAPEAQVSTNLGWSIDPLVPLGVIGGLGGAMLVFSLYGAARGNRGSLMRAGAALFMSGALLSPTIYAEDRELLPTETLIVVDGSASNRLDQRGAETQRMLDALQAQLGAMPGVNVHVVQVGSQAGGKAQDGTHLMDALNQAIADIPASQYGGAVLLTDGQNHDSDIRAINGDAPVHAFISGRETEFDRRIVLDSMPGYGIIEEDLPVRFTVVDNGVSGGAGGAVDVRIFVEGEEVATRTVTPGVTEEVLLTLPHRGSNIVSFETDAVAGELTDVNNRMVASVEGIRENMRVLLVSGAPNAGMRGWRNVLKSDPSLDLVHFTILRPPDKTDFVPNWEMALIAFPIDELFIKKLDEFDLIVFDNYFYRQIIQNSHFSNMRRYVENGGAMMVVPGPYYATPQSLYYTPLRRIMPAAPTGEFTQDEFTPRLSEKGARHPVVRDLEGADTVSPTWGAWNSQVFVTGEQGDVVMEGANESPLLILNQVENGRIAMLTSSDAWRWENGHDGGGPASELLRRVTHWLLQEPELEAESVRLVPEGQGSLRVVQQTLGDEPQPVTVTSPSGETRTVELEQGAEPGTWEATLQTDELGVYEAEQNGRHAFASVGTSNPREFIDTRSTTSILEPFVVSSGGTISRMGDARSTEIRMQQAGDPMGGDGWIGIRQSSASELRGVESYPLNGIFMAAAFITLLGSMYIREGGITMQDIKQKLGRRDDKGPGDNGPSV